MEKFLLCIDENNAQKVTRETDGTGQEYVRIDAADLREALKLLPAWDWDWIDPDEEIITKKHFVVCGTTLEDMDAEAAEYENTREGARFLKSIEAAMMFFDKKTRWGLPLMQARYLCNRHHNSLLNGMCEVFALAYRKGYKDGKKAAK